MRSLHEDADHTAVKRFVGAAVEKDFANDISMMGCDFENLGLDEVVDFGHKFSLVGVGWTREHIGREAQQPFSECDRIRKVRVHVKQLLHIWGDGEILVFDV